LNFQKIVTQPGNIKIINFRKYGKVSLLIPLIKLNSDEYYDYNKLQKSYENGVLSISIPILKNTFNDNDEYEIE
jgi:hypothetical protein